MDEKEKIPGPIGKYSQVKTVSIGDSKMLFLSGMACTDQAPFDITKQSEIVFQRMGQLLAEHGATFANLVKITAFLADIRGEYQQYNAIRNRVFAHLADPPASSSVGITMNMSAELRVEIEAIAIITT